MQQIKIITNHITNQMFNGEEAIKPFFSFPFFIPFPFLFS